ncbi:MAG TPA: protein kinase [Drouetiella sp.]
MVTDSKRDDTNMHFAVRRETAAETTMRLAGLENIERRKNLIETERANSQFQNEESRGPARNRQVESVGPMGNREIGSISAVSPELNLLSGDADLSDIAEISESLFESNFATTGFKNQGVIAFTDSSLIYRATASWLSGSVAVKLFLPDLMQSRLAPRLFSQEAEAVSAINHPNVASLYRFGIASNGAPFLISQFAPGLTLRELNRSQTVIEPLSLFIQICEALAFVHAREIIHGRLSASKIVAAPLAHDIFAVKVIDFSVCAALRLQMPFAIDQLRESASPEERFGQDPDVRSDIFSLGFVMYDTLSGMKPVFNRHNQVAGFSQLKGVAHLLEPLVVSCLAFEAKDRYQSANELLSELRDIERMCSSAGGY